MDPFTMMLIASAGLGALQGMEARKNRKAENRYRAEVIRQSPWTGMSDPGASQSRGNALTGAVGGGITGAMLGKNFGMPGAESMFGKAQTSEPVQVASAEPETELEGVAEKQKDMSEIMGPPIPTPAQNPDFIGPIKPSPDQAMLSPEAKKYWLALLMQSQRGV